MSAWDIPDTYKTVESIQWLFDELVSSDIYRVTQEIYTLGINRHAGITIQFNSIHDPQYGFIQIIPYERYNGEKVDEFVHVNLIASPSKAGGNFIIRSKAMWTRIREMGMSPIIEPSNLNNATAVSIVESGYYLPLYSACSDEIPSTTNSSHIGAVAAVLISGVPTHFEMTISSYMQQHVTLQFALADGTYADIWTGKIIEKIGSDDGTWVTRINDEYRVLDIDALNRTLGSIG